jgi:hypothetical protein
VERQRHPHLRASKVQVRHACEYILAKEHAGIPLAKKAVTARTE